MSIADAVRARELEARVAALEERVAALEQPQPTAQGMAFVQNIAQARSMPRDPVTGRLLPRTKDDDAA